MLFRHFTKDGFLANVHCAVQQELPPGKDTRQSIENRLMIYFSEETSASQD